ncbi:hypothetical protein SAMN05421841_2203 [Chryseobacterium wanjuense]|uniref:KAP family P-loop domain-containing protein n=1 Tax=Chryseobacterium wanjuense TaxID=356305 RepID=A0A1I0QWC8_9FLAO|nr:hypothetical protein [Chryseobacterium wanjuense]SEW31308.1 hypothetical protein SAMN05421841_2203 [Chryseobacterium wanjuense]
MKQVKGLEFSDENIQRLFGYEDAESEPIDRLREYYFKNETFARVSADLPIRLLVGHKGIGKSALFKVSISEDIDKGNLPILIKPDDIAELGNDEDNFLLSIRKWKSGLNQIIGSKVFNEFGITDKSTLNKLSNYSLKLINFIVESITIATENVDLSTSKKLIVDNFLKTKKIIVYIDDLDRGWEGKKKDINRLSALLNSIRDLASENPGLCFKVSLRSDVYFLVRTSDESTDKIEGSVVWYSWSNHEILIMLIKRILTYFEKDFDENILLNTQQYHLAFYLDNVMESKFQGHGKWENKAMYKILMSLIRKRPRDLVKLCTLAGREAHKAKSNLIKTEHFQNIFEEYSQGRIQDTINEYRTELPLIEKLIFGMKPSKKSKIAYVDSFVFTTPELHLKLNNLLQQNRFTFANSKIATAQDLAHFLYKINFLTARKILADGEIDRKYFEENRYLSNSTVNFGYDWEIHPAYRWALQPDTIDDIFNKLSPSAD